MITIYDLLHELMCTISYEEFDPDNMTIEEAQWVLDLASSEFNKNFCADCQIKVYEIQEYYMVHDEVWELATPEDHDIMLCVGCLETRLDRHLTALDFTDAPLNELNLDPSQGSARLRSRLLDNGIDPV